MTLLTAQPCRHAALAQLVEHRIRNAGVTGSSPVGGTTQSQVSETIGLSFILASELAYFRDFWLWVNRDPGTTQTILRETWRPVKSGSHGGLNLAPGCDA